MEEMQVETLHQTRLGFLPRVNQEKLDSSELGQRLPISFDKTGATWRAKVKIEPDVKKYFQYKDVSNDELAWISQGINRTAQDIYKNWKNELSEHFKFNGGDENDLDISRARHSVPPYMTQEVWNKCVDYFSSEEF
ncbi:hypothetical protein TorRG33x02_132450, partial [Trema orientale]